MPTRRSENLDHTLIALADPTRRAILRRLARGEARITDLAEPFSISFNSVSKHIKLLERAALVERRKAGREYILTVQAEAPERGAGLDHKAAGVLGARRCGPWTSCCVRKTERVGR